MNQTNTSTASGKEQGLNLVDMLVFFLSKWKWFLLSVLLFGSLAWLQYARSPLVYFRQATVIIKDQSRIGRDVVEVGLLKRLIRRAD